MRVGDQLGKDNIIAILSGRSGLLDLKPILTRASEPHLRRDISKSFVRKEMRSLLGGRMGIRSEVEYINAKALKTRGTRKISIGIIICVKVY